MSDSEFNLSEFIITEFSNAILPLSSLNTPEGITYLLSELGYALSFDPVTTFPSALPDITDVIIGLKENLLRLKADIDTIELISVLIDVGKDIISLFTTMKNFIPKLETILQAYQDFLDKSSFKDKFFTRLIDYLLITHFQRQYPKIYAIFLFLGTFSIEENEEKRDIYQPAFALRKIHWERFFQLITNPYDLFNEVYHWNQPDEDFDAELFLKRINIIMRAFTLPGGLYPQNANISDNLGDVSGNEVYEIRFPLFSDGIWPTSYIEGGLHFSPLTTADEKGLALLPYLLGNTEVEIDLSSIWKLKFSGSASFDHGIGISLLPSSGLNFKTDLLSAVQDSTAINIKLELFPDLSKIKTTDIINIPGLLNIQAKGISMAATFHYTANVPEIKFEVRINELIIEIGSSQADGFVQKIIPNIKTFLDLTVGISSVEGLYFKGSGSLEIALPIHLSIGPIDIDTLYITLVPDSNTGRINVIVAMDIKGELGPISFNIKEIGIRASFGYARDSSFPIKIYNFGFKPPIGAGAAIHTSGLIGTGYFENDEENNRYAGVLQLKYGKIGLVAIGLITTKLPDGSKGTSILAIIGVTFDPPITLPYNFNLHGVGGLLGINRRMDLDFIRDGISTGILDSIMFPEGNILLKVDQIINDIRGAFPPAEGRYVIGVMAQLSWSNIIFGNLGIIVEIPSPLKIALIGDLWAKYPQPPDDPVVEINLGILGAVDFQAKKAYLYLSIYNSRISFLTIEGDAYAGFSWGSTPYFVLSLGGFHPADKSVPADIPPLKRLTISLAKGDNFNASLETYLAITSKSFALGSRLDLTAKAAGFRAEGYFEFDTLFIFSPFSFEAGFGAGVTIYKGNTSLLSVKLDLTLTGPKKWHAKGSAKFSVLFIDVKIPVNVTWGSGSTKKLPQADPVADLEVALQDKSNWAGVSNSDAVVTFRDLGGETGNIVIPPNGNLEIRESVVPFNVSISKYKNEEPINGTQEIEVSSLFVENSTNTLEFEYIKEYFARSQFQKMSDNEKLSSPAYEKLDGGISVYTTQVGDSPEAPKDLIYETQVIDENKITHRVEPLMLGIPWIHGKFLINSSASGLAPLNYVGARKFEVMGMDPLVQIEEEAFAIVDKNNMKIVEYIPSNGGLSYSHSVAALEIYLSNNPHDAKILQIVPMNEVNNE